MALASPSLNNGFLHDDLWHRSIMLGSDRLDELVGGPQEMFCFCPGDAERMVKAMDEGLLPWWTWPNLKAQFLQFVTVQTHVLDYVFWPNSPLLMHLHSHLWLAALTFLVGLLYRRILGPSWTAGLATLLFAVEDAHATPAGWIANRNVLLAATFGVSCLLAHDRWARERKPGWYVLALFFWLASLCSKEAGIATSAFVFAYVVWLQDDAIRTRLLSRVPYGVVLVAWRTVRDVHGYGVVHVGAQCRALDVDRDSDGAADRIVPAAAARRSSGSLLCHRNDARNGPDLCHVSDGSPVDICGNRRLRFIGSFCRVFLLDE